MRNTDSPFTVTGITINLLCQEEASEIQQLLERCNDFSLLVSGQPVDPDEGKNTLTDLPPGKSLADKFLYGMRDERGRLVGILDLVRGHPGPGTWFIGLFLLAPDVRRQGLGERTIRALFEYLRSQGVKEVRLGVVEENQPAYRFWERMGFKLIETRPPRRFGKKMQRVHMLGIQLQG